jgi:hypothetical protein
MWPRSAAALICSAAFAHSNRKYAPPS